MVEEDSGVSTLLIFLQLPEVCLPSEGKHCIVSSVTFWRKDCSLPLPCLPPAFELVPSALGLGGEQPSEDLLASALSNDMVSSELCWEAPACRWESTEHCQHPALRWTCRQPLGVGGALCHP